MRAAYSFLFLLLACLALPARAEIVVIVHPDSPVQSLTAKEVSDLYLGRIRSVGGEPALLLDQPRDSSLRERFFSLLNGMNLSRVNAYWARLQFSGDTQPPVPLADSHQVVEAVMHNRNAIGYVEAAFLNDTVRAVLRLKE